MRRKRALAAAALLLLAALSAGPGFAAPAAKEARQQVELSGESVEYDVDRRVSVVLGSPGAPATLVSDKLSVSGERLEYSEATGLVKVEGNVRLEQSAPDQVTLTARTVTFDLKERTAQAHGEVRLTSGKATAEAGAALFRSKERVVVLREAPVVRVEENVLRGKEIVFSLADQKVTARGGSRVTVLVEEVSKGE